ncbi:MAG: hypothetical protein IKB72_00370 [Ruminococcus sp.]|nr:hypothetical protein [Ruminococcus sp.]MBR6638500.1 hypothetical protein [Lachnospiraceae bacterium]
MRRMRILSFLMIVFMVTTLLCACSDNKKDINEITSPSNSVSEHSEDSIPKTITSKNDLETVFTKLFPNVNYSVQEGSTTFKYTINKEDLPNNHFDYNIKLNGSSDFKLQTPLKDLENKGYKLTDPDVKNRTLLPEYQTGGNIVSTSNESNEIECTIYNNTDKEILAKDGVLSQVTFRTDNATTDYFTICDGITNNSTFDAVLNRLGVPNSIILTINQTENGEYISSRIMIDYERWEPFQQIRVELSGDENRVLYLLYESN